MNLSEAVAATMIACSLFGYGFFLGWWAASRRNVVQVRHYVEDA